MKKILILVTAILTLLIIIYFQNTQVISFKLFFWDISLPRIIWFLLILVIGFIAGIILRPIVKLFKKNK